MPSQLLKLYGGGFSPLSLSPALWLDTSNAASRYKERTSPTNLATATGDPVGTLMDLSGNGRNVAASTDADRPTYRPTEGMGGKPSLQFDGGGDRLVNDAIGSLFSGTGVGWTIFVVGQQTNTTRYAISFGNSSSTTTTMYFTFVDGSSQSLLIVRNDANQSTSRTVATSATATPYICCLNYTGSAVTLRRNGTESASGSLGGTFTYDRFAVGTLRRVTESETSFLGYISEVIIYPPLSSSNILSVERYLASKWGITLS